MPPPEPVPMAAVLAEITKRHAVPIGSLSDVVTPVTGLSTGNLAIDYVTGVNGLPVGRLTELYGPPSSGKTTTALQAAAGLQQQIITAGRDEYILYLDFEHALDGQYAASLGLNVEHPSFLLAQPHWLEQGAEVILFLLTTGKIRLAIIDSVAAMTPKALLEGDFDQRTAAMNRARLLAGLLQRLTALTHEQHCACVFVNHLMEAVEMTGAPRPGMPARTTTPGGKALKFYASLRLEYKQVGQVKGNTTDVLQAATIAQTVATHVKVTCTKNKVASPYRRAEVRITDGHGFDNAWSAIQVLLAYRTISFASGGRFYFDTALAHEDMEHAKDGRPYLRGEGTLLTFANTHPGWRDLLVAAALDLIAVNGAAALDTPDEPVDPLAGADLDTIEVDGLAP